jgi:hypothetical protein
MKESMEKTNATSQVVQQAMEDWYRKRTKDQDVEDEFSSCLHKSRRAKKKKKTKH